MNLTCRAPGRAGQVLLPTSGMGQPRPACPVGTTPTTWILVGVWSNVNVDDLSRPVREVRAVLPPWRCWVRPKAG